MSFNVAGEAYDQFMGRYSGPLAGEFADWLAVQRGQRALDVGCGPGALTGHLVERLGADAVGAVDPSPPFVETCRQRFPGVDVRRSGAEEMPFADDAFDVAGACLVVHFMHDPVAGLLEMARVTRPGGWIGAAVWDLVGNRAPMATVWSVLAEVAAEVPDEHELPGGSASRLEEIFGRAGLQEVELSEIEVTVTHPSFEEWWSCYLQCVGPIGESIAALDPARREQVRATCRERLGPGPIDITATAFAARARP